jgi:hypothetical protein
MPETTEQTVVAKETNADPSGAVAGWMSLLGTQETEKPTETKPDEKPAKSSEAKPEAKTETKPETRPDKPPEKTETEEADKWPRSSAEWKKFRETRDRNYRERDEKISALEKQLKERDEKLSQFSSAIDPKEFESIKTERDKLSEALRLAAVERHPRFQQYYDGKISSQVEAAKRIAPSEKADEIATLFKMEDSPWRAQRLEEIMGELTPLQSSRLGAILNSIDELRTERSTEIKRAADDYQKAVADTEIKTKAAQEKSRAEAQKIFEETLKAAQANLAPYQNKDGDETWNKSVAARIDNARQLLFGSLPPQELVRAALAASAVPALLEAHQAALAEIQKLTAQLAAAQKSSPSLSRRDNEPKAAERKQAERGSTPMSVIKDWMGDLNREEA